MKFKSYEFDVTVSLFHLQYFPSSSKEGLARLMHNDNKGEGVRFIPISKESNRNTAEATAKR